METKTINQVLPYISTDNITDLNGLIYAGMKFVCEKIVIPSKSTKKKNKNANKKIYENSENKIIRQRKNAGTCRDEKEKPSQEKKKQ